MNKAITIEQALKTADWESFNRLRYAEYSEGDIFPIENLQLVGTDLRGLPTQFICFKNCNLQKVNFAGSRFFPCAFLSCDLREADLRGASGMMFCDDCDLRGVTFDQTTNLFDREHSDAPSAFKDCRMDNNFEQFAVKQGAEFEIGPKIFYYAFQEHPNARRG